MASTLLTPMTWQAHSLPIEKSEYVHAQKAAQVVRAAYIQALQDMIERLQQTSYYAPEQQIYSPYPLPIVVAFRFEESNTQDTARVVATCYSDRRDYLRQVEREEDEISGDL